MKRKLSPLVFMSIILNGAVLIFCAGFLWRSKVTELTAKISELSLQEERYADKERNLYNAEENKNKISELQAELDNGKLILIPYSDLISNLANVRDAALNAGITETELRMDEPFTFETGAGAVVSARVSAVYQGGYENLCAFAEYLLESACHIEELSVFKEESQMTVEFSFYGVLE